MPGEKSMEAIDAGHLIRSFGSVAAVHAAAFLLEVLAFIHLAKFLQGRNLVKGL